MKNISAILKNNLPLLLLVFISGLSFFHRLDWATITSWDEGWYASIARGILRSGDFINMHWNEKLFYDPPPMGFWLMAITYKLIGINELTTRMPSAILGLFTVILVYKVGERISDYP